MFAISPPPAAGSFSSPLFPANVNLPTKRPSPMSQSKPNTNDSKRPTHSSPPSSSSSSHLPSSPFSSLFATPQSSPSSYAQRYASTIQNPTRRIAHRAQSSRGNRRDRFFDRVRRNRDESTFDARAEQMQQMECLSQRREFMEQMARAAPDFGYLEEVEEEEEAEEREEDEDEWRSGYRTEAEETGQARGLFAHYQHQGLLQNGRAESDWYTGYDEDALEELISEEQRFENFIEEMEGQDADQREGISFDDEDYDTLFADLYSDGGGNNSQTRDQMDTSQD